MTTKIVLVAAKQAGSGMSLHPQLAESLGMMGRETVRLRYGASVEEIRLTLSPALGKTEVLVSRELLARLRIPLSSRYELAAHGHEIRLGPYVGFLVSQTMKDLKENLNKISAYLASYEQVGGTIIAFALSGVNTRRRTIRGYVFQPKAKRWVIGTYGYPASLFIKCGMISARYRQHFQAVMGETIFNNFNHDKWTMYQLLQQTGLARYLPQSQLYQTPEDLLRFVQRHPQTYLKPIRGSQGKSILKLTRTEDGFFIRSRVDGSNRKRFLKTDQQFLAFARKRLRSRTYMMQKAIRLFSVQQRILDFRIIMVKNKTGHWQDMGLVTRYGRPGSVVSNIKAGGSAEPGERTLRRTLGLTEHQAARMRRKLSLLAHKVAQILDEAGLHCANMGVDIGIDTDRNVWIIEIQHNNPDHTLVLDANENRMFRAILQNNLLYLKWLAGFGPRTEERAGITDGKDNRHYGRNGTDGHHRSV